MSLTEDQFYRYRAQCNGNSRTTLFECKLLAPLISEVPIVAFMIAPEHLDILRPVLQFARDERLNTTKTLRALGIPKAAMKVPVDFCDDKMANAVRVLDASTFSQTLPKLGAHAKIWAEALMRFTKGHGPDTSLRWIAKHAVELRAQYPNDGQMLDTIDYLCSTNIHRSTSVANVVQASKDYHDGRRAEVRDWKAEMIQRMSAQEMMAYCRADVDRSVAGHAVMTATAPGGGGTVTAESIMSAMHDLAENSPVGPFGRMRPTLRDFEWGGSRTGRFKRDGKQFAVELQCDPPGDEPPASKIIFPEFRDFLDQPVEIGGFQFVRLTTQSDFKKEGYWNGARLNCVADGRYFRLACEGDCMIVSCRKDDDLIGTAEVSPELTIVQFRAGKVEVSDNSARKALHKFVARLADIPAEALFRQRTTQVDYARLEERVIFGMDLAADGMRDMTDATLMATQAMDRLNRSVIAPMISVFDGSLILDIETQSPHWTGRSFVGPHHRLHPGNNLVVNADGA